MHDTIRALINIDLHIIIKLEAEGEGHIKKAQKKIYQYLAIFFAIPQADVHKYNFLTAEKLSLQAIKPARLLLLNNYVQVSLKYVHKSCYTNFWWERVQGISLLEFMQPAWVQNCMLFSKLIYGLSFVDVEVTSNEKLRSFCSSQFIIRI